MTRLYGDVAVVTGGRAVSVLLTPRRWLVRLAKTIFVSMRLPRAW